MGKGRGHIPIRTCISCGKKRAKDDLIRLYLDEKGRVGKDINGKMPGRGAYVCKNRSCQEKLSKNKRFKRLFRTEETITISPDLRLDN